ncbi:DUF3179 domain-containing protein [Parasalinivibrio latis]|uniref:DUF3179 domain-containing protein n=1 Tax=Parasalinivibrio latis TaxID=2952610 RepID=UPI0030DF40B0
MKVFVQILLLVFAGIFLVAAAAAKTLNGFLLDNTTIPQNEIFSGGPGKDGIPAILSPRYLPSKKAHYLKPDDVVLGLDYGGEQKAFPLRILNWHEVVNDRFAGLPVVVSYCPLCGSGVAFLSKVDGKPLTFGVSGLLYNSDVLMYDHQSDSLWSQLKGEAVSGKYAGQTLTQIPLKLTRWRAWRAEHPDTLVLSAQTGFFRDYSRDPYAGYAEHPGLFFPVADKAPATYPVKSLVLGIKNSSRQLAIPFIEMEKQNKAQFPLEWEGETVTIHWSQANQSAWVTNSDGKILPSTLLYWFAWYAFNPDTEIFAAPVKG